MSLFDPKYSAVQGLKWLRRHVFIRSDNYDYILDLCRNDKRLTWLIANRIQVNHKLNRRINESIWQDNAALTWDVFGQRHTGKSWWNFTLGNKILDMRGVENPIKTIIFKVDGDIINTPSRWTKGIKFIANEMTDRHDGWRWALLQDELDPEWGEGRIKQEKNMSAAIDNLRKLKVLVCFAHVKKEDLKFNLDMRFLQIGYNPKTGIMAAILFFTRAQGIVFLRASSKLQKYLVEQYNEEAVNVVWEKAKNAFHQSAENPDDNGSIDDDDAIEDSYEFDGDRFKLLRDIFNKFWKEEMLVNETYSRLLTSFYLWSKQLKYSNSNKKISSSQVTMKKLPLKEISSDWSDEVSTNSLTQARYSHGEKYLDYENRLNTHHQEAIGETYAHLILKNEHLNLPVAGGGVVVKRQFRDSYVKEGGKAYDVVLVREGEDQSLIAFNHKLLTSSKRIGSSQLDDNWGISTEHPFQVLWYTYTRPMKEIYYVKIQAAAEDNTGGKKNDTSKNDGLGAHWKKVDWGELIRLISSYLDKN